MLKETAKRNSWWYSSLACAVTGILLASSTSVALASSTKKPVVVTFWHGLGGTLGKDLNTLIANFNRSHPGIKVVGTFEGSYTGGGPLQQKLLTSITTDSQPAIAQFEVHSITAFAAAHTLVPLDQFMARTKNYRPSDFMPGMLDSGQYQGHDYAVPFNRSVPVLYYNKAMFKAAHISGPPTTWQQLAVDAQKLTHGSGKTKVYGFDPVVQWWQWESQVLSNGGKIFNANDTKALFDTPRAELGTQIIYNLLKQGYSKAFAGPNGWSDTDQAFSDGYAAMFDGSPADIGSITKQAVPSVLANWAVAPLPGFAGHKLILPPGGGNIAMFAKSPNAVRLAAWTFIEWLDAPTQQAWWSEQTGYMPAVKATLSDPSYKAFLAKHPYENVIISALRYQGAMPLNTHYVQIMGYVQEGLSSIMSELQPVDTVMKQVAQRADGVL